MEVWLEEGETCEAGPFTSVYISQAELAALTTPSVQGLHATEVYFLLMSIFRYLLSGQLLCDVSETQFFFSCLALLSPDL